MKALAYVHPAVMLCGIVLAVMAMRAGVEVRRARRRGFGRIPDLRRSHLKLAKPAVALILVGTVGGPATMVWVRDRPPFETLHAWVGVATALLFVAIAVVGRRVEQGALDLAPAHGRLALAALLGAGAALATGFVLLP